jgi:hypothetical protein
MEIFPHLERILRMKNLPACTKTEMLAEEYRVSTREYQKAHKAVDDFTGGNYKKLVTHLAWARANANNAKQALDEHIQNQGC